MAVSKAFRPTAQPHAQNSGVAELYACDDLSVPQRQERQVATLIKYKGREVDLERFSLVLGARVDEALKGQGAYVSASEELDIKNAKEIGFWTRYKVVEIHTDAKKGYKTYLAVTIKVGEQEVDRDKIAKFLDKAEKALRVVILELISDTKIKEEITEFIRIRREPMLRYIT